MDDADFSISKPLQKSDDLMEFEDIASNIRHEAYSGISLVSEVSEVDMGAEDENICRQPSISGNQGRKRRSHPSFSSANKISRISWNVDHQQKEDYFSHQSELHERNFDVLSFQNVVSVGGIESHNELPAIQYPKNLDKFGILLRSHNKNSEVNICGYVDDKPSEEIYRDFAKEIPNKRKQPVKIEQSPFAGIDNSQKDAFMKFGIYKCDCGLMFSLEKNFKRHRRSCNLLTDRVK